MRLLDLAVILIYLVAIAMAELRLSGRQDSATAYFVGERDMPWVGGLLLDRRLAGYIYGALFGAFLLGLTARRANQREATCFR